MFSTLLLIGSLFTPSAVYADASYFAVYCNALGTYCGDGQGFLIHLAGRTAQVVVVPFIGGIAVIGVLWAAIKLQSSFGNEQGKEEAKKIIETVAVGIVLAVAGLVIVQFVCNMVHDSTGGPNYCPVFF